ncbi:MAG TPA: bifunctional diaminohydroxyphosphoribosylaminopyrimidine deaminase/5-amino-6-(5-phosphoribosylamino)uracil reductase RibD [Caulobacterales bacterium]|nr:bifunctional diaminohydroxyphosphoribosylaminopyrimidine deaminase/5-amino-6-(5-phosphoribosylamino)uracil reductase RibD [Caulobacterales bacterium]
MSDALHMARALALASVMRGRTGDNPAVGCVIVRDGAVIGEGATGEGGRPHAEEIALAHAGGDARGATAYVTLEPCAARRSGAASCADLLIRAGTVRAVVAVRDPHPLAAGGADRLSAAGVVVDLGLMEEPARRVAAEFLARWDHASP